MQAGLAGQGRGLGLSPEGARCAGSPTSADLGWGWEMLEFGERTRRLEAVPMGLEPLLEPPSTPSPGLPRVQSCIHRPAGQTRLCGQDPLSAGGRLGFPFRGGPKRPEVLIGRKLAKLGRPAWSREALEGLRAPWRGFPKRWGVSHYWGVQAERSGTVVVSQADQGETPSLRFYDFVAYLV